MNILNILNEIASDNSKLFKEAVLKREKNNKLLTEVFKAAYDPFINYWQKKIPAYTRSKKETNDLEFAMDALQRKLVNRQVTGNAAQICLGNLLSTLEPDDAEVLTRIISHDLRVGCSGGTANKVWPDLIPEYDVCLSHKDISGINLPAYAQTKMDGGRCHLEYDGESATALSRNGKPLTLHGVFDKAASKTMKAGETHDGEIVFFKNGKPLDRKTSNGLFNKAVKGTITPEEAKDAHFIVWDIVDFTSTIPYSKRFGELEKRFKTPSVGNIDLIHSVIVTTEAEVTDFFEEQIRLGREGAILKNMNFLWEPKRVKGQGKMKEEEDADLLVTGWYHGDKGKKYEKLLGGLICTTSDGLIEVNVGGGFDDDDRKEMDSWVGKIIAVKYNKRIKSKKDKKESLFLPRYIETRLDKNKANSSEELK